MHALVTLALAHAAPVEEAVQVSVAGQYGSYGSDLFQSARSGGQPFVAGGLEAHYQRPLSDVVAWSLGVGVGSVRWQEGGDLTLATPLAGLHTPYGRAVVGVGYLVGSENDGGPVLPTVDLQLGPESLVFAEYAFYQATYGPSPGSSYLGLGVGLPARARGRWNHPVLRAGVSAVGWTGGLRVGIGEHLAVDARGSYGGQEVWGSSLELSFRQAMPRGASAPQG